MSLRDDNFKDKHLAKALKHAPDSDVAPSESARKVVLDYADNALKTRHKIKPRSWFARAIKAFNDWQLPGWQLAGMGSLAASLLVVVMIWHENPDDLIQIDPVQVATAPETASSAEPKYESSSEAKLAQNELAKDEVAENDLNQAEQAISESAPIAASAEMAAPKLQDKAKENVLAKAKSAKPETETAPQTSPIQAPADKAVLASAPEVASAQTPEKEADSASAKEAVVMAEAVPPVPVAAAPTSQAAPQAAPTSAGASADAASEQTVARAAPMNKAAKKMADTAQSEAKADLPSAIAAKPTVKVSALAIALSKQGGQALANADIQAGKLRILYLSNVATTGEVDEQTGYRKETVFANEVVSEEVNSKSLAAEVEAYNQTMRAWRFKN